MNFFVHVVISFIVGVVVIVDASVGRRSENQHRSASVGNSNGSRFERIGSKLKLEKDKEI